MDLIAWLLDSDPSIRWQVMRDITKEPKEVFEAERSKVATEGWGARLLSLQDGNGQWGREVLASSENVPIGAVPPPIRFPSRRFPRKG